MSRFDFLFDEGAPFDEIVAGYQHLIDTGLAWGRADAVGRTAGNLVEDGYCVLGERGFRDADGRYTPSRHELERGAVGSMEYAAARNVNR